MRLNILGVGFDDLSAQQAVSCAYEIISGCEKGYIATPNPEIVMLARKDNRLSAAIEGAKLVLPDGVGIIIAARILGTPLRGGRVPGIDFTAALFEKLAESGRSVFLLGAAPGVAHEAGRRLAEKYQGLLIAGTADGYFDDDEPVIAQINSVSPDVLLVCLGAPKQEFWMASTAARLNVSLCIGLGGSLDVFAGKTKRAPVFFRKLGLEWLYRLCREPRRIKRMIKLPLFILMAVFKRLSR